MYQSTNANRTYPTITSRFSSRDSNGTSKHKPLRALGHYGSTTSLRSLVSHVDHHSAKTTTSLRTLDLSTGSLVNLLEGTDFPGTTRRRSPSLPPIYTKDNQQQPSNHPKVRKKPSDLSIIRANLLIN